MPPVSQSKVDVEALGGLASAILGILGAQVIMLGIIGLAVGSRGDQIISGMVFIVGTLMSIASVLVWTGAHHFKSADATVNRAGAISKGDLDRF
jgi:hypothetical protein